MTIKTFIRLPQVRFGIHVLLLAGIMFNIVQLYRIHHIQGQIEEDNLVLSLLVDENNEAKNSKDYYNSDLFKEKYAKERLFKVQDERVFDTSSLEQEGGLDSDEYIPTQDSETMPNYRKWLTFLLEE